VEVTLGQVLRGFVGLLERLLGLGVANLICLLQSGVRFEGLLQTHSRRVALELESTIEDRLRV
jgi:hypothetical protein